MTKLTKTTTFEAPEGFAEALPKVQNQMLHVWLAANPTATIRPIAGVVAEGALPAYIRKPTGKRADIVTMMVKGMPVAKFMPEAGQELVHAHDSREAVLALTALIRYRDDDRAHSIRQPRDLRRFSVARVSPGDQHHEKTGRNDETDPSGE